MNDVAAPSAIPNVRQSATSSIHRSLNNLNTDANVVARSQSVESKDVIHALLDSRQQLLYTAAAAKLIKASDEMQQSLIDIRA